MAVYIKNHRNACGENELFNITIGGTYSYHCRYINALVVKMGTSDSALNVIFVDVSNDYINRNLEHCCTNRQIF